MTVFHEESQPMQDGARGSGGERGRACAGDPSMSAPGRGRRRWSDEEKARVVLASLRPGERVVEVARRYGVDGLDSLQLELEVGFEVGLRVLVTLSPLTLRCRRFRRTVLRRQPVPRPCASIGSGSRIRQIRTPPPRWCAPGCAVPARSSAIARRYPEQSGSLRSPRRPVPGRFR